MMEPYRYSPLPTDNNKIRLIRLLPGGDTADIKVEIFHEKVSSRPTYSALSYAWGSPEMTDTIFVREDIKPQRPPAHQQSNWLRNIKSRLHKTRKTLYTLPIARNLEVALRHLRYLKGVRILWIDAICINQRDLDERSSQVELMSSIYSKAREVIVWLGPSSETSDLAVETLRRVGQEVDVIEKENRLGFKLGGWIEHLQQNSDAFKLNVGKWRAVGDFLRREWFYRLWVFQEISLANFATILVGKCVLDWEEFKAGTLWCLSHPEVVPMLGLDAIQFGQFRAFLRVTGDRVPGFPSLDYLIWQTKHRRCFDPRDRFFALRSLCGPIGNYVIRPNYTLPVEEVFRTTAIRSINYNNTLDTLRLCNLKPPSLSMRLPSWVPGILDVKEALPVPYGQASGRSKPVVLYEETETCLRVHCIQVATITYLAPSLAETCTDSEAIRFCRAWELSDLPSGSHIGGCSQEDAFIEAINLGGVEDNFVGRNDLMSLDSWRHIFRRLDNYSNFSSHSLNIGSLRTGLLGRRYFRTEEGSIGLCPESAEPGDQIFVLLGCSSPLALRSAGEDNNYRVVGECYVLGMMNSEALLGPLPPGWSRQFIFKYTSDPILVYIHSITRTQKDPRLGPLPSGWSIMGGAEPILDENWGQIRFQNIVTGEDSDFDPRMTLEALRDRGVDLQEITLI